jgi:phosphoribosylaminoimidazole (AIR) synthetase
MVLIVEPSSAKSIIVKLAQSNISSWVIGETVKGRKEVEIS